MFLLLGAMLPSVAKAAITYEDSLQPSVLKPGDWFGYSSALSGDTLVVGAYSDSSGATGVNGDPNDTSVPDSGAAYVFVRRGTKWTQQAYLKASNVEEADLFGWSVAVSGDTVAVPAMGELAAHIYVGAGSLPPQLSIERAGGGLRVFWPLPATGFVLDEVPALNASPVTGWSTVPVASYQTNATHVSLSIPQPSGQKFYRLRRP